MGNEGNSGIMVEGAKCQTLDGSSDRLGLKCSEKEKTLLITSLDLDLLKSQKIKSNGWATEYYQIPEGTKEIQDLIEHKKMNFAVGNIFKACYRLGAKEGIDYLYDLRKIAWYVDRELKRLENNDIVES